MQPALGETIVKDFVTSSSTGAAVDADALPTCEVFEDANDTAILAPTVVKRTGKTGNYRISIACTSGNGFETGKSYNVIVSATVGGIVAKAMVASFQVREYSTDAARTEIGVAGAGLTAITATQSVINANVTSVGVTATAILDDTGTTGVVVAAGSKAGYTLSATGLDAIPVTAPTGVASTFPQMIVQTWRRWFKKTTLDADEIKTYLDNGSTVVTTQLVSDDGTTQTQGAAT